MQNDSGFTLLELIVGLILVALLSLVAGMGLIQGVEGYLMTRENATLTQTSQIALERLRREILLLNAVTAVSGTQMQFSRASLGTTATRTIGLDGQTIKIAEDATPLTSGDTLVGGVDSFSLAYFKADGSPWVQGTDTVHDLAAVQISLTLSHPLNGGIAFSTTVNPRNNGVLNAPIE